jgi:hypothetical protein
VKAPPCARSHFGGAIRRIAICSMEGKCVCIHLFDHHDSWCARDCYVASVNSLARHQPSSGRCRRRESQRTASLPLAPIRANASRRRHRLPRRPLIGSASSVRSESRRTQRSPATHAPLEHVQRRRAYWWFEGLLLSRDENRGTDMNPYGVVSAGIGTAEAESLRGRLMAWHDAMVAHERRLRSGQSTDVCSDECPHVEARTLWAETAAMLGARADSLTFLRSRALGSSASVDRVAEPAGPISPQADSQRSSSLMRETSRRGLSKARVVRRIHRGMRRRSCKP